MHSNTRLSLLFDVRLHSP